jgi:hypothetical protein
MFRIWLTMHAKASLHHGHLLGSSHVFHISAWVGGSKIGAFNCFLDDEKNVPDIILSKFSFVGAVAHKGGI